jgi:hypothetical protein
LVGLFGCSYPHAEHLKVDCHDGKVKWLGHFLEPWDEPFQILMAVITDMQNVVIVSCTEEPPWVVVVMGGNLFLAATRAHNHLAHDTTSFGYLL